MRNLSKLRNRRVPADEVRFETFAKKAAFENDSYQWLVEATQPIDPKYTNETFEQGDRVRDQLRKHLDSTYASDFEYQGSVTSDTHVRYHSDIDLLVLSGIYTTYPGGHPISNPVTDEVVECSLRAMRRDAVSILNREFPKADVDDSGSKAVKVSGGSLKRDIDVVLCNWWNTKEYLEYKVRANRGIQVLNLGVPGRIGNKPFLHNWHIEDKDIRVEGGLRKAIRLLKNLKYDREPEAKISSYDLAALAFRMEDSDLIVRKGAYLTLARNISRFLHSLIDNSSIRERLYVPNGTRRIFSEGGATLESLKEITAELDSVLGEISNSQTQLILLSEAVYNFSAERSWIEARASRVDESIRRIQNLDRG